MFESLKEQWDQFSSRYLDRIKEKILGTNNENLDFVMDSFYKLDPNQRNIALSSGIGVIIISVLVTIFIYFSRINALDQELNKTFTAIQNLQRYKYLDSIEGKKFQQIVSLIEKRTRGFNFKPFFEQHAQNKNINIPSLNKRVIALNSSDPLSKKIKEVNIEMKIPKISIPRILDFLALIEKSKHFLRVQDIKISGEYGNRLYFDVALVIRGYELISN